MGDSFAIEIDNLTKYYGPRRGIEDLVLCVPRGISHGFLGPNGAGKTTTLRLLMGLLRPTSGRARVCGLDVVRDSLLLRTRVGYLPGEVHFFNNMTGYGMLKFLARLRGVDCRRRAESLAGVLNLDLRLKIRYYSRGMRQKLGIIQAMMHDPELLILDEPTNSLDPLVQQTIYDLLNAHTERGGTVFFSSHIISEVERICRRVAIIRAGRVVADDDIDDLRVKSLPRVKLVLKPGGALAAPLPANLKVVSNQDREVHLVVHGSAEELIDYLDRVPVEFLTVETGSLEDVFMRYYRSEKENHVGQV